MFHFYHILRLTENPVFEHKIVAGRIHLLSLLIFFLFFQAHAVLGAEADPKEIKADPEQKTDAAENNGRLGLEGQLSGQKKEPLDHTGSESGEEKKSLDSKAKGEKKKKERKEKRKDTGGKDKEKEKKPKQEHHEKIEPADKELPPLKTLITAPFGERRLGGPTGLRIHSGLDIRAHLGWAVVAFGSGEVTKAGFNGNAGIMVEITQDDGFISRYAHLQTATVFVGQRVDAGEKVGEVGCTGYTTGAHLHFALVAPKAGCVDPMKYLKRAEDILRPSSEQIPKVIGPQQCTGHIGPYSPARGYSSYRRGPVIRGRNGKPMRFDWNALRNYRAPEIPLWQSRSRRTFKGK